MSRYNRSQNALMFENQEAAKRGDRPRDKSLPDRIVLPEREIQPVVVAALRAHPRVAWVHRQLARAGYLLKPGVYDRLIRDGHLRPGEADFLKFGWKGQLDLTGQLVDGRRIDVEVKREDGKATPDQQATIDAVNGARGVAFVARSAGDVFDELAKRTTS